MSNQQILNLLAQKSVQATPMRMLVLEQFLSDRSAKSLQDLEALLPYSDRSTIYRTLRTFEQKSVLHQVDDGSGVQRYARCNDACSDGQHQDLHPHFHCLQCQDTICLQAIDQPGLQLPPGYQVQKVSLRIDGKCPACHSG